MTPEYTEVSFGKRGSVALTSSEGATSGNWACLQVINDAVMADITSDDITNVSNLEGITLTAGTVIYARITSVTVTSGVVLMYNHKLT